MSSGLPAAMLPLGSMEGGGKLGDVRSSQPQKPISLLLWDAGGSGEAGWGETKSKLPGSSSDPGVL